MIGVAPWRSSAAAKVRSPLSSISSTVILLRLPTMDPKALSFANFVAGWALAGSPIWS